MKTLRHLCLLALAGMIAISCKLPQEDATTGFYPSMSTRLLVSGGLGMQHSTPMMGFATAGTGFTYALTNLMPTTSGNLVNFNILAAQLHQVDYNDMNKVQYLVVVANNNTQAMCNVKLMGVHFWSGSTEVLQINSMRLYGNMGQAPGYPPENDCLLPVGVQYGVFVGEGYHSNPASLGGGIITNITVDQTVYNQGLLLESPTLVQMDNMALPVFMGSNYSVKANYVYGPLSNLKAHFLLFDGMGFPIYFGPMNDITMGQLSTRPTPQSPVPLTLTFNEPPSGAFSASFMAFYKPEF